MNSVQFCQRLLRYLTIKTLAQLPIDDALGLCDATNAAIQEYYTWVPTIYKHTGFSGEFKPAQTITANFTNGSNEFTGWAAPKEMKGYTIVITTDQRQNRIVGSNQLFDKFTGITGTWTAQVYGDCIHMQDLVEKFTTDPTLVDFSRILVRDENFRRRGFRGWGYAGAMEFFPFGTASFRRIGMPMKYWIEPQGQSRNADPPFMLRIDSLPDQLYRMESEGFLAPSLIYLPDLTVPIHLPVDDLVVESTLLPMAIYYLRDHPLWADKANAKSVQDGYDKAKRMVESRVSDKGPGTNVCYTPRNW